MALNAEGKAQNVKASLERYAHEKLVVDEGLLVHFEGLPFEPEHAEEWVEESILGFVDQRYHRQVDRDTHGQTTSVLLNFSVFVNRERVLRTNRPHEVRDVIYDYFTVGTEIPLYDFYNQDFENVLDVMTVAEVVTDGPVPNEDYQQWTLTLGVDWLQKW